MDDSDTRLPHFPAFMRAYSYVRMSTHRQLRGDSLRRQLERSRAFADEHSLLLDDSLRDLGVSAWKGKNFRTGALGRFLAMVESGEIPKGSYLLIESLDRLSREAVPDALTLFMAIINAGIVIATLGDDRQIYSRETLNGDWTRLIIGLAVMSRGHEESRTKSERISAANQRKRERARSGEAQITGQTPAWIDAERIGQNRYTFTLNDHAATIRHIYELAARGLGSTAIAKQLNANAVPTFGTESGWYQSIIKAILRRQDVIGTFQPHRLVKGKRVADGDAIADYFPAAIDKDLFLRVQAMRQLTGAPGRRGRSFANLFTGLCFCAHCHGPMTMKLNATKSGTIRYLLCSNHARNHRCGEGTRYFRYDRFEAAVLDHVHELNLASNLRPPAYDQALAALDETIAGLALRLDDLVKREERLALSIECGGETLDSIIELLRQRQAERHDIEAKLRHHRNERQHLAGRKDDPAEVCNRIGRLRSTWEKTDEATRYDLRAQAHAAIREIITEITFDSQDDTATVIVGNGIVAYKVAGNAIIQVFRVFPVA